MDYQLPLNNNFQDLLTYLEIRNPIFSSIPSASIKNLEDFNNFDNIFENSLDSIDNTISYIINLKDILLLT